MISPDQYHIVDDAFRDLIIGNVSLRKISSDHLWTEGPVWFPAHNTLLFSDIPNHTIHRYVWGGGVDVFRNPSAYANGHTRDPQGRLVSCQHGSRSVTRTEHDGSITTLADSYLGKKLNSPNDVVVKSDGSIWFTDPTYGILSDYEGYKAPSEQAGNHVFALDPGATELRVVTDMFVQPNGLAFSADETSLYVAESGSSHDPEVPSIVRIFDVMPDGSLEGGEVFATIDSGLPDGMRVDVWGNLWSSAADGVHCFAPDGRLLGKIVVPETVSNLTFGGPRGNVMFITATSSVYAIFTNTKSCNGR